jgi:hypothetical protein
MAALQSADIKSKITQICAHMNERRVTALSEEYFKPTMRLLADKLLQGDVFASGSTQLLRMPGSFLIRIVTEQKSQHNPDCPW